ncbi:DUF1289 domain-containing protein [Xanthobacter sp. DSM 24535]|uniref:DUF1289 domain-containing protein n=1 Tax=Roseixanthobacter psychrophilus TaxID=3119917 RepID=UPI0037292C03
MSDAKPVFPSPFPAAPAARAAAIETPCVKLCQVDPLSSLCVGCGRTTQEIGGWISMSPARRSAVMAQLPERLQRLRQSHPEAFAD